jgi:hypothetical protein
MVSLITPRRRRAPQDALQEAREPHEVAAIQGFERGSFAGTNPAQQVLIAHVVR